MIINPIYSEKESYLKHVNSTKPKSFITHSMFRKKKVLSYTEETGSMTFCFENQNSTHKYTCAKFLSAQKLNLCCILGFYGF